MPENALTFNFRGKESWLAPVNRYLEFIAASSYSIAPNITVFWWW